MRKALLSIATCGERAAHEALSAPAHAVRALYAEFGPEAEAIFRRLVEPGAAEKCALLDLEYHCAPGDRHQRLEAKRETLAQLEAAIEAADAEASRLEQESLELERSLEAHDPVPPVSDDQWTP